MLCLLSCNFLYVYSSIFFLPCPFMFPITGNWWIRQRPSVNPSVRPSITHTLHLPLYTVYVLWYFWWGIYFSPFFIQTIAFAYLTDRQHTIHFYVHWLNQRVQPVNLTTPTGFTNQHVITSWKVKAYCDF